jgi:hypothetical protein
MRFGDGLSGKTGGVQEFARYLKRAVPGMELISFADMPNWREYGEYQDYDRARILNNWLLEHEVIDKDSVVVVDGYWGSGLQGYVDRLISVCHGSYFGRLMMHQISPWGEVVGMDHVAAQVEFWKDPFVEVVAVSGDSAREMSLAGVKKEMRIITHGVDLDVLKPMPGIKKKCLMHGATSTRKGLDILQILDSWGIEIEFMNERSGKLENKATRLNQARLFVAPTRHEGNAYMLLEALACGVPLLTYYTGQALDFDDRCGIVVDNMDPNNFKRIIEKTDFSSFSPREYAEENLNFERFANEWKDYLNE